MRRLLLLITFSCIYCWAFAQQTGQITGLVKDQKTGDPLIGVVVRLKDGTQSAVTNATGKYSIKLPDGLRAPVLTFNYIGYKLQEVIVGSRTVINVELEQLVQQLDEVVVAVGYGTMNKRDVTGSVSSVTQKELKDIPINSLANALAGRLAGVQITSSEGSPDGSVRVKIRGGGSITQDNSPLYVIEGIQVENGLASLAPTDIETIDVLKDAATTAIYGARGANGVVIITTKGGKEGKTIVSYNGFAGVNLLAKKLDVMDPYQFIVYQWERSRGSIRDSTNFNALYGNDFNALQSFNNEPLVNWQDKVMGRDALMQTHTIGINGGTKTTQFNVSFNANQQDGIMLTSGLVRKMLNAKLDHTLSDKFRFGISVRYNNQQTEGAGVSNPANSGFNGLRHLIKYKPFLSGAFGADELDPEYYTETNFIGNGLGIINPVVLANSQVQRNTSVITNLSGYANYSFSPYLSFRSSAGYDQTESRSDSFEDSFTPNGVANSAKPLIGLYRGQFRTLNVSNVFTYSNSRSRSEFRKRNEITAVLGSELYQYDGNSLNTKLRFFPTGISADNALNQLTLGQAVPAYPQATQNGSGVFSFFTRINYTRDRKYLFTFTYRADGSSKFSEGNNWGYFPSGSVAWRLSEEGFLKNSKLISDLKIRASYGLTGNNRIGDYLYQTIFNTNAVYALNHDLTSIGFASPYLANPNLKWETTISRNLGLDISILKGRFQLTVDAYQNNTRDLLLQSPISLSSGYGSQLMNQGETRNTGIEAQLSASILKTKNFGWVANFNMGSNENKIVKLSTGQNSYLVNSGWGISGQPGDYIVQVGQPVGTMFGYVSDGFYAVDNFNYDPVTRRYTIKPDVINSTAVVGIVQPGGLKIKDVNGDGVISATDRTIIGRATPKLTGGLNQQFNYKGFDLSVFVNFSYGNDILNANKLEFTNGYTPNTNLLGIMNKRWRTIDENGQVIQQTVTISGANVVVGAAPEVLARVNKDADIWLPAKASSGFTPISWAVEDGSFLRLNNVTLGYTFTGGLLTRAKIKTLRVYATGNNLAILTNYTGFDPEVDVRRGNPVTQGVDYSAYPRSRTYLFGVNLTL